MASGSAPTGLEKLDGVDGPKNKTLPLLNAW